MLITAGNQEIIGLIFKNYISNNISNIHRGSTNNSVNSERIPHHSSSPPRSPRISSATRVNNRMLRDQSAKVHAARKSLSVEENLMHSARFLLIYEESRFPPQCVDHRKPHVRVFGDRVRDRRMRVRWIRIIAQGISRGHRFDHGALLRQRRVGSIDFLPDERKVAADGCDDVFSTL